MATQQTIEGRTPRGGVKSVCYYMDKNRNPCEKDAAVQCEIIEYDARGKVIGRTYGYLRGWNPGQEQDEGEG